ncbi:BlaI/MecI/CopY family transcriptional regulator [Streptomyces synnematoformans]|uniref:BlaI/MecI/CopY family transcriptional regulator n=1 Tax=Streptomyces synnematoformans TaxID=415721 RepID=A0ABN2Y3U9_9ACTN
MRRSGELGRAVMDVLWDAGRPCTAKEVLDALPDRGLAYTTVITVLERLARKGTAHRERIGRSWRYTPAATRESYVSSLMMDILAQAGDRDAVLTHFARSVSEPEADVLREALDRPAAQEGEDGTGTAAADADTDADADPDADTGADADADADADAGGRPPR